MRQLKVSAKAGGALLSAPLLIAASFTAHSQALEEITVTARKTAENLQEVPLAITALGAEQIDRLGVKDLSTLSNQDTSVQFDEGFTPSDTRITIRGLSPTRGRPNAAALIDGIDITSEAVSNAGGSLLIDPRLVDVQRIEIVKGPQSALYGRSAFAGAVQYVTKDPSDVPSAGVFIDYNAQGDEEIRGNISIPITETFGMRLNGLAWQKEGYYTNSATGRKLGDGDGSGATLTLKWEPTDTFDAKWRTDYSDDRFGVAAQVLLNDFNKFYDLGNSGGLDPSMSNLAPLSGLRPAVGAEPADRAGCYNGADGGFLDNYDCGDGLVFDEYLRAGTDPTGTPVDFGIYDEMDPWLRNVYNKQVTSAFTGEIPDGDQLTPAISPDYRNVPAGVPLSRAPDFAGTNRIVFRNSLVMNWDISDTVRFASYTGFTDAKESTATDLGKYYVDNCRPDPSDTREDRFSRQICDGGDGINDNGILFQQDSNAETKQLSQQFRVAWDVSDSVTITQGLQYWRERVSQAQKNATVITSGPICYLAGSLVSPGNTGDISLDPFASAFFGYDPRQYQCGNTFVPAAYWASTVNDNRPTSVLKRGTNHYSWYGQLKWNVTEKFTSTFEARFTREDNTVDGEAQARCLYGVADEFLANPDDPGNSLSPFRDSNTGRVLCKNSSGGPGFIPDGMGGFRNDASQQVEYSALTGPGSVLPCGQTGRCDNLDQATVANFPGSVSAFPVRQDNSWWPYGFAPQGGYATRLNRKDRYWAPKLTLEYFWNDDVMTYFSWSRGIKPGGFSLLTQGAFGLDANGDGIYDEVEFEPERLDVWEIGAKTTLMDGRLRLNGSLFYQDFKDKQVTVQAVVGETIGTKVENISGSEVQGLELDATFQATDNLRVSAGYTYLDSEYTDYTIVARSANDITRIQLGNGQGCSAIVPIDPAGDPNNAGNRGCLASFNGNSLERVPEHAFLLNANYTNSFLDTGLEWFTEVSFQYQDSRYLEAFNIVEFPAYTRTNLSVGLIDDTWDLQFYVSNLFDDDTVTSGGGNPGIPTASFGFGFEAVNGLVPPGINAGPKLPSDVYANMPTPRLVGARANFRFGE